MPKKKLLHIVEAFGGGVFTYICDLCNKLFNEYDIYIAYALRNQTPENFKNYFNESVTFIEVKNFTRSINLVKDLCSFFEIKKIVRNVEPDIIHLHSSKAGVIGRIAFGRSDISTFYTPHGYSFLMRDQSALKCFMYKTIEKFCGNIGSTTTIGCSIGEYQEGIKISKNADYVSNGVDVEKMNKMISNIKKDTHDRLTVSTLGRICFQKNPELFNEIALAMPDLNFIWIGDGEMRNMLTAKNITITGWQNRDKALAYALNSDVFILTSLWEGLPISLLEAMYMKKLCVVSDVIGNHDVIKNKVNGFVCNNQDEYVRSINEYKENPDLILKIVEEAKSEVLTEYNTDTMAQKYKQIYIKYD